MGKPLAVWTPESNIMNQTLGRKVFIVLNYIFLFGVALTCLLPLLHVVAVSFSSKAAVTSHQVALWPVDFNLTSYIFVAKKPIFLFSILNSIVRTGIALPLSMIYIIITAYPLSRPDKKFRWRVFYVWFFFITMLIGAGLIPTYFVVDRVHLVNTVWALILPDLPGQIFNVILLLSFFRRLPVELEEAARIDGAKHWQVLVNVLLPVSKPVLATIALFIFVQNWNSWFDGLIYMNRAENYPLATYLRTILIKPITLTNIDPSDLEYLKKINDETSKAAQIIISLVPILCVYPFLQKYFTTGLVLGSVKG